MNKTEIHEICQRHQTELIKELKSKGYSVLNKHTLEVGKIPKPYRQGWVCISPTPTEKMTNKTTLEIWKNNE